MRKIEAKSKTPEILIDESGSEIKLKGILVPENPTEFFNILNTEITDIYNKNQKLSLSFQLEYFNTGAAKYLYEMFKMLKGHNNLKIIWLYDADDEDIYESGIQFQELSEICFEFQEI